MTDMAILNFHNSPAPAGTAVRNNENTQTGAGGALERFFHKLELLLKNGHLPDQDDVTGERLPSELQDLKTFLEKSPGTAGDFVLQHNDTERYRFSKQDGNLTVTMENKAVRSGRTTETESWTAKTITVNVLANSVLAILNGQNEINTEKNSQSGPAPETPSVTGQGEPAEAASPSVATPPLLPGAEQNATEPAATAAPEVTDTETKTNELSMKKTLKQIEMIQNTLSVIGEQEQFIIETQNYSLNTRHQMSNNGRILHLLDILDYEIEKQKQEIITDKASLLARKEKLEALLNKSNFQVTGGSEH